MLELKNCPFCRSYPIYVSGYVREDGEDIWFGAYAQCCNCGARISREFRVNEPGVHFEDEIDRVRREVIEAWNRRVKEDDDA